MKVGDAIRKFRKVKVLLVGDSGTGKTYSVVRAAVESGKKTLFIDTEFGAIEEFASMGYEGDEVEYVPASNYEDVVDAVKRIGEFEMVVLDSLDDVVRMKIVHLENKFIELGYYVIGDRKVVIKNPECFVLPWNFYPSVYSDVVRIVYNIIDSKVDVVVTTKEFGESESKKNLLEVVKAKFDSVIKLDREVVGDGNTVFYGVVEKNRGKNIAGKKVKMPETLINKIRRVSNEKEN